MKRYLPHLATLNRIDDYDSFSKLRAAERERIVRRLDWIFRILESGHGGKGELAAKAAAALEVSVPTVSRFVKAYKRGGWRALGDQRGYHGERLPDAFRDFVRQLHLQVQRAATGREVHRALIERWRKWQRTGDGGSAVPGYDTPPPAGPKGYPRGWSEDTILRMRPDAYALALARQGSKRAGGYLPSILKTRVGTKFGAVVFFDDQDYDLKVAAPGLSQRALRPQGFNCLDYLSGCFMEHAIRLKWWDAEGKQYRTLTQEDFTWFVISYLQRHGYRQDGTTLVFEHGTATGYNNRALPTVAGLTNFDEALMAVSHGAIRVERSGLFNKPAFAGMMLRPQSSGNPNFKAPLESLFNLVRNRMAALPAATGRNRDTKPAEQYGADLYTGQLLKAWERLDDPHRELMRFPMLTAGELGEVARAVYQAINSRTDHGLEGWENCGFVAPQFRFTPDERSRWLSRAEVMELPENSRAMLLAQADAPGHVRTYKLSPADVAAQRAGELTKLADHLIPLLVPLAWARPATVRPDRTIALKEQLLGAEPFQYVCRIEERGRAILLQPETKLLCYLNPFNAERLTICDEAGAYIGTLNRMGRAGWSDKDAILGQLKERAAMKADMDTAVRPHLTGLMDDRAEMKRTNDRLVAGKPVLPEKMAAARAGSARAGVRTRKLHATAGALGADALDPANLLADAEADDVREPCTPAARTFSAAAFLTPDDDRDE